MSLSATFSPAETATSGKAALATSKATLEAVRYPAPPRPTLTMTPGTPPVARRYQSDEARREDERVGRCLQEFVRRRDRIAAGDRASRTGDTASLDSLKSQIAHHYTGLVEVIARRFQASGEPFDDLVQEGFLGLLSALENYDPGKNVKFSTYATHFVAGAIRHFLRDRGKMIKEPAWLNELNTKVSRTTDTLTQKLGRAPHSAEIAHALNLTEEAVEEFLTTRQVFKVAAFESSSDDSSEGMAGMVDPEKIRSDKYVTLQLPIEDRIVLEEAAQKLKALEQKVIYEFFYKDRSQTEIARSFDISCNYVSHILKNATGKLKRIMGEADVRDRCRHRESSIVDAASGLYTRQHLTARIDEEISRAARAAQSVAVLRIDLESTTPIKGTSGDTLWAACGDAVRKSIRRMDMAARFDNNQIVVLLPQTGETCDVVADRLRGVLTEIGAKNPTRFSVNLASAIFPENGRTAGELLGAAA